ncbi:MAG: hypothetical protein LQ351_003998 [Letrouitia transgressa]|nr:MAG: hypothetical protein LQ351_003998 [Letrouitia transgressa]
MENEKSLKSKMKRILEPRWSLETCLKPFASPLLQWITFLTLTDLICTRAELVQISSLKNLGILTIGQGVEAPDIGLEDVVIRAWSRAAAEAGAFSRLRVFILDSQPRVTAKVFTYLDRFPSLGLFVVQDSIKEIDIECFRDPQSHWKYLEGSWFPDASKACDRHNRNHIWTLVYNSCFRDDGTFDIERIIPIEENEPYSAQDTPVIDLRIGDTVPTIPKQDRESMTFYRTSHQNLGTRKTIVPKRPLNWSSRQTSENRKKPRLRASKQQPMDRLSINLG